MINVNQSISFELSEDYIIGLINEFVKSGTIQKSVNGKMNINIHS